MHHRQPVGFTCPDIDDCIDRVNDALKGAEKVTDRLDKVEGLMERLRDANAQLREWGEQEAGRVDELETELGTANDENRELERRLDAMTDRVNDLQEEVEQLKDQLAHARAFIHT